MRVAGGGGRGKGSLVIVKVFSKKKEISHQTWPIIFLADEPLQFVVSG